MATVERRIFGFGAILVAIGGVVSWGIWGVRASVSLALGGLLGGAGLYWLRGTVHSLFLSDRKASKARALAGYSVRLLLIPLSLYVMLRLLFLNVPAVVAGFALFNCGVLVEGVFEALSSRTR